MIKIPWNAILEICLNKLKQNCMYMMHVKPLFSEMSLIKNSWHQMYKSKNPIRYYIEYYMLLTYYVYNLVYLFCSASLF